MKIKKIIRSKISDVNFSNLLFGRVFSDHMLRCVFSKGKWQDPEIIPSQNLSIPPACQVLHYGQSVFEGMKAFKNQNDEILVFRPYDNFKRLNKSAKRLSIPVIPENIFIEGINELLKLDGDWCKKEDGYSLYLRPFIFASSECIKASPSDEYTFIIITSPTKNYYTKPINLVIEEYFSRSVRGGVGYAKAAGNYASSFYPIGKANEKGFTQVIWTDAVTHQNIEESGTMNIWFRINNKLITPELSDTILDGITRDSILNLAQFEGLTVEERVISVDEILRSYQDGALKESFGTGTAVTIASVESIRFRDKTLKLSFNSDSIALRLKKKLQDIQYGRSKDVYGWTSKIL